MKTLGEAAMELPWLAPSARSMTALAKSSLPVAWNDVRIDPGFVLLSAQLLDKPTSSLTDAALLEALARHQNHFSLGFVDWNQPGAAVIQRSCQRTA